MSTQNNSDKNKKPIAVLFMAYGSPENVTEVGAYFTHIRGGMRPREELITAVEERYRRVGGKTPLVQITREQAAAVQKQLDLKHGAGHFKVFIGMKHWHPFIKETLKQIADEGITNVIAIALAPHYSKISIGGYQKAIEEAQAQNGTKLNIRVIEQWHTNAFLIDCITSQLEEVLKKNKNLEKSSEKTHIVFTAHSLPERIREWNDPYEAQLTETSELIAKHFPDHDWSFSFQSAGHTGEPWIGPDILDALAILKEAGKTDILICPIGFVSDNLEIVFDLDIEAQEEAKKLNIRVSRTDMRNTHPLFIDALCDLVQVSALATASDK